MRSVIFLIKLLCMCMYVCNGCYSFNRVNVWNDYHIRKLYSVGSYWDRSDQDLHVHSTCVIASQYATSIVNRCWSGIPCKWRYINVETFNL